MTVDCGHGSEYLGYYAHPEQDIMVAVCSKCYEIEHGLFTLEPFITRYGRKLIDAAQDRERHAGEVHPG